MFNKTIWGNADSGCLWSKANKNLQTHSRNAGILLMSICILLTSCIIPPVTACFQNLRFCNFGECFLKCDYNYKDLWEKTFSKLSIIVRRNYKWNHVFYSTKLYRGAGQWLSLKKSKQESANALKKCRYIIDKYMYISQF